MSDLMQCLSCKDHFAPEGMHICQKSKAQVCIKCSGILRAERRADEKRKKEEQLRERNICQAQEREAKSKAFADSLSALSKCEYKSKSKKTMLDVDKRLAEIREQNIIDSFS